MEFMEGRALGKEKVKQNAKNKKEPEATGNGVYGAKTIPKKGVFGRFIDFF